MEPNLSKTLVIFFDFEYYVPETFQQGCKGICYNPYKDGCKLIAGSFLSLIPSTDFLLSEVEIAKKIKTFTLWEYGKEIDLVRAIFKFLDELRNEVNKAHNWQYSPILCGIGISNSDIPTLLELMRKYTILSPKEIFKFQNNFRTLDLSQLSIASYKPRDYFLYPKSKKDILKRYLPNIKIEHGSKVWELYENKDYQKIIQRIEDEVICTFKCYKSMKEDFENINL